MARSSNSIRLTAAMLRCIMYKCTDMTEKCRVRAAVAKKKEWAEGGHRTETLEDGFGVSAPTG